MIQGLLVLTRKDYVFQPWHGTLLFYTIITLSLCINPYFAPHLPKIESIVHVIGFFRILIPLVYLAPHDLFATFNNGRGWILLHRTVNGHVCIYRYLNAIRRVTQRAIS